MHKISLYILISFICSHLVAQDIYKLYNQTNFRKSDTFKETIVPEAFDAALLNACIFFATNEIRAKKRLPILAYHKALEDASEMHSQDMVNDNFFNHINHLNTARKTPDDRARIAGINNPYIAENIIEGFVIKFNKKVEFYAGDNGEFIDPKTGKPFEYHTYLSLSDKLLSDWMDSEGHRKNILSENGKQLGCGAVFYLNPQHAVPSVMVTQSFQWFEEIQSENE
jgi:uncharacterized protein YkwD